MLFELKEIIAKAVVYQQQGIPAVLATVVALDGSSYRKPGVRMLIAKHGETIGAVSGGCVEKEVVRQSKEVFESNTPKIMTYDGRYRLGCEGVLYILIEPIQLSHEFLDQWAAVLAERQSFELVSAYDKTEIGSVTFGTVLRIGDKDFSLRDHYKLSNKAQLFTEEVKPALRLFIFGTEHDAVQMCLIASKSGFEVTVISSIRDPRTLNDFPGATSVEAVEPDFIGTLNFDKETAIILMTHNYSRDFQYAINLLEQDYCYFGIIGSYKRRNMLFDELLEYKSDVDLDKLEAIRTPAGLDIGAITPQEIAVSVISEILVTKRKRGSYLVKQQSGIIGANE